MEKEQVLDPEKENQDQEVENQDPEPQEPSDVEQVAMKLGWNPDMTGPKAVDAETYILRSKQINDRKDYTIRSLRKEIEAVREGVEAIKFSSEQQRKKEVSLLKTQISELKSKRRAALKSEEPDVDEIEEMDSRIDALKDSVRDVEAAPKKEEKTEGAPDPIFVEWVEENEWYTTDPDMRIYADKIGDMNAGKPLAEILKIVDHQVAQKFPDKFNGGSSQTPTPAPKQAAVASSRRRPAQTPKKATADDLDFHQKQIGLDFVAQGVYENLDAYAQALQEMAGGK